MMAEANERFSEDELWAIADDLVAALAFLQSNHIPHLGLETDKVYICGDIYKISPFQNILHHVKSSEVWTLKQYRHDAAALGRVLLEASNLGIPHLSNEENLHEAANVYSAGWAKFISELLNANADSRPDVLSLYKRSTSEETLRQEKCEQMGRCSKCYPTVYTAPVKTGWVCPDPNCAVCVAKRAVAPVHVPAPVAPVVTTGWKCPDPNCAICVAKRAAAQVPKPVYAPPPVVTTVTTGWKCPDPDCAICVAKRAAATTFVKKTVIKTSTSGWVCPRPNCDICRRARGEIVDSTPVVNPEFADADATDFVEAVKEDAANL